jgi:hypothetical protein
VQGRIALAESTYAAGVARFGAQEAAKLGAVEDLKNLVRQGRRAAEAQKILARHWEK